jgi:alkanesulfonate monooxygenase SsuD/methylene tetrahydromethanopterin reductase-like flavin-dependent oxidoreductase (luciferase family)
MGEKRTIPLAARFADGWDSPLGPSPLVFGRKAALLAEECERVGRDPATIRRSARIGVVRDAQQARDLYGQYAGPDTDGAVLFGSDDRLLEGVRAYEDAGADQVLFAGSVVEGTEQLARIAAILGLRPHAESAGARPPG